MNKTWSVILSIVITALIIGGGVYFYTNYQATQQEEELNSQISELENQVESLGSQQETEINSDTEQESTEDESSTNQEDKIRELISEFETLHKKHDAEYTDQILALFTDPENDSEEDFAETIAGRGEGGPILFGSATFSYRVTDYEIKNIKEQANDYLVKLTEYRKTYSNSDRKWYGPNPQSKELVIKQANGEYKIDQYYNSNYDPDDRWQGSIPQKYEGFYSK